ncbi:MAG: DUF4838 domain-containing protein [Ignavibacteriaceae bacterium]
MKFLPALIFLFFYSASNAQSINLVTENKSNYKIILSADASHWDSLAAKELQYYLKEVSGVQLQINSDSAPLSNEEIVIGKNKHSESLDISSIKDEDGFIIKSDRNKIYFAGGGRKGTLNAVYTFLEKFLNCRMYSHKVKIIPKQNSITLPELNITENPVFSFRSISYYETTFDEYSRWHKLADSYDWETWGMFVHTFESLLPHNIYFKDHPEYYALRDSLRVPEQPCLTNPDVFNIVVKELKNRMKENPEAGIWSVSQNDNYSNCQCPGCSKLDNEAGSASGSLIHFINRVAAEFPDKIISTLAYQYSRKAPKNIIPEKNVNIMLCSIECYRTEPLEADTSADSFTRDLMEWSQLTDNLFIWDYVVQFTNLVSPFPNFHVLQPNIKLFRKYDAKMMFQQGAGERAGSEFGELRTYIIAKLLWNPDINVDSVMNDFLSGYYGEAGTFIKEYIGLMTDALITSGAKLWIYDNPIASMKDYLSPELLKKYSIIFDKAENLVNDNPDYLQRVKEARLPLKYAMLEQAKVIGLGENGTVAKDNEGNYKSNPFITSLLEDFLSTCSKIGTVYIHEKQLDADTYGARYKTMLSKTMKNPAALFKPVKYIINPSPKYPANGFSTLTDGYRGDEDHHFNWQGFEGEDMEAVIDLQQTTEIKKVSADFLQIIFSWIFLPEQVEISISDDGNNFKNISVIKNPHPLNKDGAFIHTFAAEFDPIKTRYIKVKAKSIKTCPRWHPGYPLEAWIFTDEIVVE